MVQFNFTERTIKAKVVYYGPAQSGKTTNLEQIHRLTDPETGIVEGEAGRQDADHGGGIAIEVQSHPQGVGIGAHVAAPEAIADHHHMMIRRPILLVCEGAPQSGLHAEEGKE